MTTIFLTTEQVNQFLEVAQDAGYDAKADTVACIASASYEGEKVFSALQKTDYPGPEGYWICRYDPYYFNVEIPTHE